MILRLRICDREVLNYPMRDEHLHFLRNAGLFKHLVADIPGALVSWVLLHASNRDTTMCGDEGSTLSSVNVAEAKECQEEAGEAAAAAASSHRAGAHVTRPNPAHAAYVYTDVGQTDANARDT